MCARCDKSQYRQCESGRLRECARSKCLHTQTKTIVLAPLTRVVFQCECAERPLHLMPRIMLCYMHLRRMCVRMCVGSAVSALSGSAILWVPSCSKYLISNWGAESAHLASNNMHPYCTHERAYVPGSIMGSPRRERKPNACIISCSIFRTKLHDVRHHAVDFAHIAKKQPCTQWVKTSRRDVFPIDRSNAQVQWSTTHRTPTPPVRST